jgi:septum formation protein
MTKRNLILGSTSKWRKLLLEEIGLEFDIIKPVKDEILSKDLTPYDAIVEIAKAKNMEVQEIIGQDKLKNEQPIIITADTMVLVGDVVLGKAEDEKQAREYLGLISGKTHQVITGHVIFDSKSGKYYTKAIATEIQIKAMSDHEITEYLNTGEWKGKAGCYDDQGHGGKYILNLNGDYPSFCGISKSYVYETLRGLAS